MKLNCLSISILSLIIFIVILYLINKNNNIFSFESIENYEEPLKAVILNARNIPIEKPLLFDITQLTCDNNNNGSFESNLCLNKYTLSYSNIIP